MSVYYRFLEQDVLLSVIHAQPRVTVVSGSSGWRGSVDASSSVSLFGGVRGRKTAGLSVTPIIVDGTWTIEQTKFISGSYPALGSIQLVKSRPGIAPTDNSITPVDWYAEHTNPILRLYDYNGLYRANYATASYDFHALFFKDDTAIAGNDTYVSFSTTTPPRARTLSSSYTIEAWVKPIAVTSSNKSFGVVAIAETSAGSLVGRTSFYITGSTGCLALSASDGSGLVRTSSLAVTAGVWQHIAVVVGAGSGTFKINNVPVGTFAASGSVATSPSTSTITLYAGARPKTTASFNDGFLGYVHDVRVWNVLKTDTDLSSSYVRTLTDSASLGGLVLYARFNDGPLETRHGKTMGSGAFDYAGADHGQLNNFNLYRAPSWQPCDNPNFTTVKVAVAGSPPLLKLFHIPALFYGKEIVTGSVRIEDRAYDSFGIQRVIVDDGRGGLYLSGSVTRPISGEEYGGVAWNRVGNVFYGDGLVVITHPTLLDIGEQVTCSLSASCVSLSFRGSNRIPTKVFNCRLGSAQGNASNNPQFASLDSGSGKYTLNSDHSTTYVTAVGIYNEDYKLVAIAKIAQPIRKREKDKLAFRLKMDF